MLRLPELTVASILPRSCTFLVTRAFSGPPRRGRIDEHNTRRPRLDLCRLRYWYCRHGIDGPAAAAPPADRVLLAPHRAIYDLKLSKSQGSRGIEAVRGRILYDFSGNACEGYELKFRQVSQLDSREGQPALSDLRSTTWETAMPANFASVGKFVQ